MVVSNVGSFFTSTVGQVVLGVTAAGAIVGGTVLLVPMGSTPDDVKPTLAAAPQETPTVVEEAPAIEEEAVVTAAPTVDTLRVEANGEVLIAGQTAPNTVVAVVVDGVEVARATSDGTGGFVAFAGLPPSTQTRALILQADPDGAEVVSDQSYFIAPVAAPEPQAPSIEAPEQVAEEAPEPDAQQQVAPAVIVADAEGVTVVQSASPQVLDNVALDSITYDPEGEVLIAGRAAGDGFVKVYLDNKPITTSRIADGGNWRTDLPQIDTGVYTLRVDEVDVDGAVVSRIETPFKREEPEIVAAVLAEETSDPDFQVAMTTVQPGATLWAIALDRFGDGVRYVEVFEANRDLIKNPDLIYPGQVFRVPTADE